MITLNSIRLNIIKRQAGTVDSIYEPVVIDESMYRLRWIDVNNDELMGSIADFQE